MSVRLLRVVPGVVVAATLALGVAALPAQAATTAPPYEPDASSVGSITFYDANGAVVRSGSTDVAPFAAYAVGSHYPRSGDPQAQLLFANPNPGAQPYSWYKESVGLYNSLPVTSGPSNIQTLSQSHPVVINRADDQTLDGFREDSVAYTADGYTNTVQIRLRTANATNSAAPTYDVADVVVDPTTHTWTQVYGVAPGAPAAPTATAGDKTATVRWTAPASDGGFDVTGYTLQDSADGGTTWLDVPHTDATTSQVVTGLTNGTSYVFRVAAVNSVGTGDFSAASAAVKPVSATPPPADPSSLTLAGTKAILYGQTITVTGTLKDTKTGKAVAGQAVTLKQRTSSTAAFTTVKTLSTSTAGVVSLAVKPASNVQYQWVYAGTATLKAASSAVGGVTVAPTVTVAINHTGIKAGQSVSVYGAVNPAIVNQKVYLQQLSGSTYKTTKTVAVVKNQKLPNGKTAVGYVLTLKISSKATYTFRVYVPATSIRVAGYSAAVKVKVS